MLKQNDDFIVPGAPEMRVTYPSGRPPLSASSNPRMCVFTRAIGMGDPELRAAYSRLPLLLFPPPGSAREKV